MEEMDKLQELIEKFRNDTHWNTENKDGTHRFDEKLLWIESMIKSYAENLNMTIDEVVQQMESKRTYTWPNYYQESNFPPLDKDHIVGVFQTFEEFRDHTRKHWQGFKCSGCGEISSHPQECLHRIKKDGECDWCSYGIFKSDTAVVILENGLNAIPIFEPVPIEQQREPEGETE